MPAVSRAAAEPERVARRDELPVETSCLSNRGLREAELLRQDAAAAVEPAPEEPESEEDEPPDEPEDPSEEDPEDESEEDEELPEPDDPSEPELPDSDTEPLPERLSVR